MKDIIPRHRMLGLASVCASFLLTSAQAARSDDSVNLGYEIAWGHLTLATASVRYREAEDRYEIDGDGETDGFLEYLFDWQGAARTAGDRQGGARSPSFHEHYGEWSEGRRATRVDWGADDPPKTKTEPPPDHDEVTPVAMSATAGSVDPFTALLGVLDRLHARGRCEGRTRIWDGRRLYRLKVTHDGPDNLEADRPWSYAGPTVRCRLAIERMGGFRREPGSWSKPEHERRQTVWVAKLAGERWIPVRAEFESSYGTIVGRLRREDGEATIVLTDRREAPSSKSDEPGSSERLRTSGPAER
jgi:hypothetical protein